jgi:hypothetical protein
MLLMRFKDFERYFGPDNEITRLALRGDAPARAAANMRRQSVLGDSARTAAAVAGGRLTMSDPAVQLAAAFMPVMSEFLRTMGPLNQPRC